MVVAGAEGGRGASEVLVEHHVVDVDYDQEVDASVGFSDQLLTEWRIQQLDGWLGELA